jgi:hypothetical protein
VSALAGFTVTSAAAVRIVNASAASTSKITAFGGLVYLGADNTVTAATGVVLDPAGEKLQFTGAGEIWAIAKDTTTAVRVLSWA